MHRGRKREIGQHPQQAGSQSLSVDAPVQRGQTALQKVKQTVVDLGDPTGDLLPI